MYLNITLQVTDKVTPKLHALIRDLDPRDSVQFFTELADDFEILTREHIARSSRTRHKTAGRLGARPTGYLERAAGTVAARGTPGRVSLEIGGEIFKRAFGEVIVKADPGKALTLPWRAETYGRRAREFEDLFIFKSRRGAAFLARRKDKRTIELMYLLKKQVTLPQDRGLLPSEAQYLKAAEKAAAAHVKRVLSEMRS